MNYKITQEQLQTIANYLVKKPFNEVAGLIQIINQLEIIEEKPVKQ